MNDAPLNLEQDLVLLLTASVNPKGMPGVSRPDPAVREQDYCQCLQYYLAHHPRIRRIVFAENSAWPLDQLRRAAAANPHHTTVEFISLNCNDFRRDKGKSYGEALLMDQAIAQSALCADARYIAKLTGRNYLLNLTAVLTRTRRPFDLLCDIRDHKLYEWLGSTRCGHHADTRLLVFTPLFFDHYVRPRREALDESAGRYIETLFYELATMREPGVRIINRFPIEPDYRGLAGHWNKDYGSPREQVKKFLRGTTRRLAPWLRI